MRKAAVKRATKETDVEVSLDLDGTGVSGIATGIGFLDHMLDLLARHSRMISLTFSGFLARHSLDLALFASRLTSP